MEKIRKGLLVLGRGTGQVMFQNNAFSGALMGAGLLWESPLMALWALLGNATATGFAVLMKYDRNGVAEGLYGFNGTLVGLAIAVFMPVTAGAVGLLLVGACLTAWLAHRLARQRVLPGLTAPFVGVTWLLLALCRWGFPALLRAPQAGVEIVSGGWLACFFRSIGQVLFQGETVVPGLLFLLAVGVNSRRQAVYASVGAGLAIGLAVCLRAEPEAVNAGLMGYNGVLCAMALEDGTRGGALRAAVAVVLSVGLQLGGMALGLPVLTAPFVLAVWMVVGGRVGLKKYRQAKGGPTAL